MMRRTLVVSTSLAVTMGASRAAKTVGSCVVAAPPVEVAVPTVVALRIGGCEPSILSSTSVLASYLGTLV